MKLKRQAFLTDKPSALRYDFAQKKERKKLSHKR